MTGWLAAGKIIYDYHICLRKFIARCQLCRQEVFNREYATPYEVQVLKGGMKSWLEV